MSTPAASGGNGRNHGPEARHTPAHSCPMCGMAFDEGLQKCGACPMHGGCETTCCPRCGYSFADRSATVDGLMRIGRRLRRLFTPGAGRAPHGTDGETK